jgi:hypothetical protein
LVKKQQIDEAKKQFKRKKKTAENLSFTVIGKEISLENLVKKEEEVKEAILTRKLEKKIAEEKRKSECLEKAFQERELDDEFIETEKESMAEIDEVHENARKKIKNSRNKLRRSIQQMKMKTKTKNQNLSNQLKHIRDKMSKEIMLANKNGSEDHCRKGKFDVDYREKYCNENFVDDWTRNSDCKAEDFCYICCENEFGAMYVTQRDNCYKMCDYKPRKKKSVDPAKPTPAAIRQEIAAPAASTEPNEPGVGKWVWAPIEKTKA